MSNHIANIVGKSFLASIGEPWDFESDAGRNILKGRIRSVAFDHKGNPLLLCEVTPFLFLGKRITCVVAVNRYVSSQNVLETLHNSGSAALNLMFTKSGDTLSATDVESALHKAPDWNFLVGTMQLLS